ncbi:MAG: M14 family metallopeptidase [Bacillota bacterium]
MPERTIAGLTAAPGQKVTGWLPVPGVPGAEMPVILIQGANPGPTLAVTAGVHGAEYGGIAAASRLAAELDPAAVAGTVVIVPTVNMPAYRARVAYVVPLDGKNPNRVFPGSAGGTAAERIAYTLQQEVIRQADALLDLHGGDLVEALVPFSIYHRSGHPDVDQRSRQLAEAFGIRYVLESAVQGAAYAAAAEAGVPAIIAEAGQQGIYDPAAAEVHLRGVRNVMRHLGMLPGEPERFPITHMSRFLWIFSDQEAQWYPGVACGDLVQKGQVVGELRDPFGTVLQRCLSPGEGAVLFLVTALAVGRGDPLLGIGQE